MHVGNLLCALVAYLSVKSKGGKFIIRIEDIDAARCSRRAAAEITETLRAIGIRSDAPVLYQSERRSVYSAAERVLRGKADIYPCFCSRAQLHGTAVKRLADGGILYPGTCKKLTAAQADRLAATVSPSYRISVPDETVRFCDGIAGEQAQNLARECGDFIIRRSDGVYAYQLAVVVDDGESGVTEVVRGADLLYDTPRQIYLQRLLDLPTPEYFHIPLVCDSTGRKLSKSAGDSAELLLKRKNADEVLGALAYAAGIIEENRPATLDTLVSEYSADKVRRDAIFLPPDLM